MAIEGFADVDFHAFHREVLPAFLRERGAAAGRAVRAQGSLAFRLPSGDAYTYLPREDGVEVVPGEAAADTVMELAPQDWEGLVHDYESASGLLYHGRARCRRGDAMRFVGWEPALRALYTGREPYEPERLRLLDRHGRPLDPERVFRPDEERDDLAHFLRTAGYLFVRGVFSRDEIDGFLEEARELRREARPGDRLSWWAKDPSGEEVLCRVTRAADKPRLATLRSDPRILALIGLADERLVHWPGEGNGVTVIFKNPGIQEGLSDLPWHRDCGLGGHALMCPTLIASIFLTPASAETGELRFLPGSWTRTAGFAEATDPDAHKGAGFRARPGDVTVHYGDGMHAAPPPTRADLDTYRWSAIVGFRRPGARNHHGMSSYNEVLHQRDDGQIENLAKVAKRA